eukprot:Gb_31348 [translate_table: standard]
MSGWVEIAANLFKCGQTTTNSAATTATGAAKNKILFPCGVVAFSFGCLVSCLFSVTTKIGLNTPCWALFSPHAVLQILLVALSLLGEVSEAAAMELGFPFLKAVPVLHCCGDAGACSLGAGAGIPGSMYCYLGTSGWVAGSFWRSQKNIEKELGQK